MSAPGPTPATPARLFPQPLPIASAPRDGTRVIALEWFEGDWTDIGAARFETDPNVLCGGDPTWVHDEHGSIMDPTHWYPWPADPNASATARVAGDTELPVEVVNTVLAIAQAPTDKAAEALFERRHEDVPERYRVKLRAGLVHAFRSAFGIAPEPAR